MNHTKNQIIGNVEGILRDYEDGYHWDSLLNEIKYSDLKAIVTLAKKTEQYQKVINSIAGIEAFQGAEKLALESIKEIVRPFARLD